MKHNVDGYFDRTISFSQSEKLGDSLLQTVLRKTYTRELLVSIVRTGLHTTAAVALINRLLPVVSDSDDSQLVDRVSLRDPKMKFFLLLLTK